MYLYDVRGGTQMARCMWAWLVLGCTACQPPEEPEDFQTPTVAPEAEAEPFDASGWWGYRQVLQQYVKPPIGEPVLQKITAYGLATLEADADQSTLTFQDQVCLIELTKVMGAGFTMGEGYYQNPPTPAVVFTASSLVVGGSLSAPQQVETYGVVLTEPLTDALPTSPDDPRVTDFDHDENPGFTIEVTTPAGTLWTVNRFVYELDGVIYTPDYIAGLVYGVSENAYLYSSSQIIPTDTQVWPSEEEGHNFYDLVRLSGPDTCAALLEAREEIFVRE